MPSDGRLGVWGSWSVSDEQRYDRLLQPPPFAVSRRMSLTSRSRHSRLCGSSTLRRMTPTRECLYRRARRLKDQAGANSKGGT